MPNIDKLPKEVLEDPVKFAKFFWPDITFYNKQREILYAMRESDETIVVAGNMLGKDFVAGYLVISFFLYPKLYMPEVDLKCECCGGMQTRVVTTSVKDDHLRILWGEMGKFVRACNWPMQHFNGGPLVCNFRDIYKVVKGQQCRMSYVKGMTSEKGEAMAGHHAHYNLLVIDEASGVEDIVYEQSETWAKRKLIFGNPNPCAPTHFFRKLATAGDLVG